MRMSRLVWVVMALMLGAVMVAWCVDEDSDQPAWGEERDGFQVAVGFATNSFMLGEQADVSRWLKNTGYTQREVSERIPGTYLVTDSQGRRVDTTAFELPGAPQALAPGESMVAIDGLFNLLVPLVFPDTYTVAFLMDSLVAGGEGAVSAPVDLELKPRPQVFCRPDDALCARLLNPWIRNGEATTVSARLRIENQTDSAITLAHPLWDGANWIRCIRVDTNAIHGIALRAVPPVGGLEPPAFTLRPGQAEVVDLGEMTMRVAQDTLPRGQYYLQLTYQWPPIAQVDDAWPTNVWEGSFVTDPHSVTIIVEKDAPAP